MGNLFISHRRFDCRAEGDAGIASKGNRDYMQGKFQLYAEGFLIGLRSDNGGMPGIIEQGAGIEKVDVGE